PALVGRPDPARATPVLGDLGGAGEKGAGPRPEARVRPRLAVTRRGAHPRAELGGQSRRDLAVRAQDLERQLEVALLELAVGELGDRRGRARALALVERRQDAQRRVALDLQLGVDAAELGADEWIVDQRTAGATEGAGGLHQLVEGRGVARHPRE